MADSFIWNTPETSAVTKLSRSTVADGNTIQRRTIYPLSARDEQLLDWLNATSARVDDRFEETSGWVTNTVSSSLYNYTTDMVAAESATRKEEDDALQDQLDTLKAAADVVDIFENKAAFNAVSAEGWTGLTDKDIVKILHDESFTAQPYAQTYYQCKTDSEGHVSSWTYKGHLDPYYNISEIDTKFVEVSAYARETSAFALDEAKTYTDTKLVEVSAYARETSAFALDEAKTYTDEQLKTVELSGILPIVVDYDTHTITNNSSNVYVYPEFNSWAEGYHTSAVGFASHAEGDCTIASERSSHAEGAVTKAAGFASHAEGYKTIAAGDYSHAGGYSTSANGHGSFTHGYIESTGSIAAVGNGAVSMGASYNNLNEANIASGTAAIALGIGVKAYAPAYGGAVALGRECTSYGDCVFTEGFGLTMSAKNMPGARAEGLWNKTSANVAYVFGNGTGSDNRSDLTWMDWSGNTWQAGNVSANNFYGSDGVALSDKIKPKLVVDEFFISQGYNSKHIEFLNAVYPIDANDASAKYLVGNIQLRNNTTQSCAVAIMGMTKRDNAKIYGNYTIEKWTNNPVDLGQQWGYVSQPIVFDGNAEECLLFGGMTLAPYEVVTIPFTLSGSSQRPISEIWVKGSNARTSDDHIDIQNVQYVTYK